MISSAHSLEVCIAGTCLPNPVGVASGTFGFGSEYASLTDLSRLGALYTKALTLEPRSGNPPPRVVETPSGMINAIGLANPGLKGFLRDKVPLLSGLPCPVIVNVAGDCSRDYAEVTEAVSSLSCVWGVELNVSCPNVDVGGLAFGTDAGTLSELVAEVRRRCSKPLLVKLSPNVTDIAELARAAAGAGADALCCANTWTAMSINTKTGRPVLPRGTGGLSGPAVRPLGVAAVWRVCAAVDVPVVGIGGILNTSDALEYLLAGASALQVGTALFANPDAPGQILEGLRTWMTRNNVSALQDIQAFGKRES